MPSNTDTPIIGPLANTDGTKVSWKRMCGRNISLRLWDPRNIAYAEAVISEREYTFSDKGPEDATNCLSLARFAMPVTPSHALVVTQFKSLRARIRFQASPHLKRRLRCGEY
jgi:hypothetical protein